MRATPEVLDLK